jgi:prohibitin 2
MKLIRNLALAAMATLALAACTEVPVGSKAVVVSQGTFKGVEDSGLVWHGPLTDVIPVNLQQQKWESETSTYTQDVQQAAIKFTLTYRLDPGAVQKVYTSVGQDWETKLIPQVVEETIKAKFGQAEAVKDAINNRAILQQEILVALKTKLKAKSVIVEGFELKDISFSKAFEDAVEQKQIAVEKANAAKNRTVEIEENARQKIITAEADAKAMQIKSAALSGNPGLTAYEAAQRWDGRLPQMVGSGQIPFITLPKQ